MDELTTAINTIVDEIDAFVTQWNLKQGGASVVIATIGAYKVLGVAIPASAASTAPATVEVNDGDSQSTTPATALSTDLAVIVKDGTGTVVNGAVVTWESTDTDAAFSTQSITDATGVTSIPYTTGFFVGDYTVTASVDGATSATFTVTTTAGAAATLSAASVTDQNGSTSTAVAVPPSVSVVDAYGNVVAGETVTFAVTAGGGSRSPATVDTGADGIATLTSWTLGAAAGANTLTATAAGLTGSPITFTANAVASTPTQIAVTAGGSQTGVVAGQAATTTTWTVKDAGNNAVQGVTVAFAVASGNGSLSAASAVTNASGQASVTYTTHTTVETATISASFNAGAVSASTTIASTFGTASKLALQTQPSSSGDSGTALSQQPIVLVQDANGNTVTTSTATITASIQSGNATISGGSTKAAVAGVATFSGLTLVDTDGGSNVIRFSSGALTVVDSTGTTLAPPVPVAVQFQVQPGNATTGVANISCAAWVVDSSNVLVTSATNAITVALTTPGGATLSGTLTVNASGGVASFSGLAVDTAGTYTLTATATGLTSAVSASFTITAASTNYPNEPAGFSQITIRQWSSATENGWSSPSGGTLRNDGVGLPTGLSTYIIHTVPNGSTGTSLGTTERVISSLGKTRVYASLRFRISANFQGHSTQTNKLGLWLPAGSSGNSFFLNMKGKDQNTLGAEAYFQGVPTALNGGNNFRRILSSTGLSAQAITRGVWHQWELDYTLNTYDVANGVLKMWLNGVLFIDETDIGTRGTGGEANQPLWRVKWNPIWGGTGTANTNTTQIECAEIYVSG